MPAFTSDTMHHDFLALMDAGKTFDEFINDPANRLMSRQRVRMMQEEVYQVMGRANIFLKGEMI